MCLILLIESANTKKKCNWEHSRTIKNSHFLVLSVCFFSPCAFTANITLTLSTVQCRYPRISFSIQRLYVSLNMTDPLMSLPYSEIPPCSPSRRSCLQKCMCFKGLNPSWVHRKRSANNIWSNDLWVCECYQCLLNQASLIFHHPYMFTHTLSIAVQFLVVCECVFM